MCEFNIILKEGNKETKVADSIVYARMKEGNTFFSGLGVDTEIEGGLITELNVIADKGPFIKVIKSPIINDFLSFLDKYNKLKQENATESDIKSEWEKISDKIKNELS